MDWLDPPTSDLAEERQEDMSSLAIGFIARMRKRATSAQGETTLGSEVYGGKRPRRSGPKEKAQKSPLVIAVDSSERASDDLPALEGASHDASREDYASLEDRVPVRGLPDANGVVGEAPSEINDGPSFLSKLAKIYPHRLSMPNRQVLGLYVLP